MGNIMRGGNFFVLMRTSQRTETYWGESEILAPPSEYLHGRARLPWSAKACEVQFLVKDTLNYEVEGSTCGCL